MGERLYKTKIVQVSNLIEIVRHKIYLEMAISSLTSQGHYNQSETLRSELSGINKVLDALKLRTEVIILTKMIEEGKIYEDK